MRIAILQESGLTPSEVGVNETAVLAILALHAGRDGTCWPSRGPIARPLGKSRPWVVATIGRLVDIGILAKTHRTRQDGGERSCVYRLVGCDAGACPSPDAESSVRPTIDRDGFARQSRRASRMTSLAEAYSPRQPRPSRRRPSERVG